MTSDAVLPKPNLLVEGGKLTTLGSCLSLPPPVSASPSLEQQQEGSAGGSGSGKRSLLSGFTRPAVLGGSRKDKDRQAARQTSNTSGSVHLVSSRSSTGKDAAAGPATSAGQGGLRISGTAGPAGTAQENRFFSGQPVGKYSGSDAQYNAAGSEDRRGRRSTTETDVVSSERCTPACETEASSDFVPFLSFPFL